MGEKNNQLFNTLNKERKQFAEKKVCSKQVIEGLRNKLEKIKDYLKEKLNAQQYNSRSLNKGKS
jgi:hypothetical protein